MLLVDYLYAMSWLEERSNPYILLGYGNVFFNYGRKGVEVPMRSYKFLASTCVAALLSIVLVLSVVGTASAHAKVIDANPKIGSTIAQAPKTITVTTVENMKPGPQNSNLFVYGPSGDLISEGNATIPLNSPKQMSINIKDAGKGVYIVRWITVSADDGDPDQGAFTFTVGAAASTPAASNTNTTQTPTPSTTGSGTPLWVAGVIGLIALLVGMSVGMGLGKRSVAAPTMPTTDGPKENEHEVTR
jgi:methionine-rich copper-binding protein CopC